MNYRLVWMVGLATMLWACKKEKETCAPSEEILEIPVNLNIERLEPALFEAEGVDDIAYLLEKTPGFAKDYLQEEAYESREALVISLDEVRKDTLMQALYQEVVQHYRDISPIEQALEEAFQHILYYYPEFKVPKVYTFVSGFNTDLYINKEMIVIGLDFFLPADHRFQPPEVPGYIAKRYNEEHLVPMIVTALSSQFNDSDPKDRTLLAEMIFYGKAYHFTQSMLPCVPEELIIGYTSEEVAACYANEDFIWTHLIEQEAIYETNPFEIRKYTGEAPSTDVISPDAPGRVGRWVGWNIVDEYSLKNEVDLPELMAEKDAVKLFRKSGYKPRR